MTATQVPPTQVSPPPTPPPPAARPVPPGGGGSRALPVVSGALIATVGAVVALLAAVVLAFAGGDGRVASGSQDVSTPTAALVSGAAVIDGTDEAADVLGRPDLHVTSESGKELFVGVARSSDVDAYLAGVAHDEVTDVEVKPYGITREGHGGTARAGRPADERFWIAQSTGTRAALDWKIRDGSYRVVVMNADGSRGVDTQSEVEVGFPHLSTWALGGLVAGLAGLAGGIVLMTRGGRRAAR